MDNDYVSDYVSRDRHGRYADQKPGSGPALMRADTLLGNDVYNSAAEDLGDVKDIMIDMSSGTVAYALLSFGGVLGMGGKLLAVPWRALTLDTVRKRFTLDIAKETLKDAPGFDKDRWPSVADATWGAGVHKFWGTTYHER